MSDVPVKIARRPTLAIKFVYWLAFILIGLYMVSPFYMIAPALLSEGALTSMPLLKTYGAVILTTGSVGMFVLLKRDFKYRHATLEVTMFFTFLLFIFFTILRIETFGLLDLAWVSYLINALVAGVVHFKLQWEK